MTEATGARPTSSDNTLSAPTGPDKKRRGLVLQGGGAKGAWQFGVLEALAENGIEFDAISGTSVGALNGAIWSVGAMDKGRHMWRSMALTRLFNFRWVLLPSLLAIPSRLYYSFFQGYVPNARRASRASYLALSLLTAMAPLSALWSFHQQLEFSRTGHWAAWALFAIPAIGVIAICAGGFSDSRSREEVVSIALFMWVFAFASATLDCLTGNTCSLRESNILWIGGLPIWLLALAWVMRWMNVSLYSALPLSETITDFLSTPFRVPLFATAARESGRYFDPDNLDYIAIELGVQTVSHRYYQPAPHYALLPVYNRVDLAAPDRAREMLLASSALPLGVVPARTGEDGSRLVDGGTVDNIPWFPLIEEMPCDELVIVHCNPAPRWSDQSARSQWAAADRLRRVIQLGFRAKNSLTNDSWHQTPPSDVPLAEPKHWPARVIVIAPEKPLGNFFTGTMNFSKSAVSRRLADGREAGLKKIPCILGQQGQTTSDQS